MAFIPFPDGTMEAIFNFIWNGNPCVITQGWRTNDSGVATVSDGETVADNLASWMTTSVLPALSSDIILNSIKVNDLTAADGWTWTTDVGVAGGVGTVSVPNNNALVVSLLTGIRGRSFKGRNYIPGLPYADLDSPLNWKVTTVAGFTSFYEDITSSMAGDGYALQVLSRFTAGAPRSTGVPTPVISIEAKIPIYTQRGRLT